MAVHTENFLNGSKQYVPFDPPKIIRNAREKYTLNGTHPEQQYSTGAVFLVPNLAQRLESDHELIKTMGGESIAYNSNIADTKEGKITFYTPKEAASNEPFYVGITVAPETGMMLVKEPAVVAQVSFEGENVSLMVPLNDKHQAIFRINPTAIGLYKVRIHTPGSPTSEISVAPVKEVVAAA